MSFPAGGFPGGRVENIAVNAGVNKAMIFYYFGSKERLYHAVIRKIIGELVGFIGIDDVLEDSNGPEKFLDAFSETYTRFFSRNRRYLRVIGIDMIQNPLNLKGAVSELINSGSFGFPQKMREKLREWDEEGRISESDPVHFFLNIISVCIFPLIARVFPESIFGLDLDNEKFVEDRIKSVKNLLKRGMLK